MNRNKHNYTQYTYRFADGSECHLQPGQHGVTAEWLAELQELDRVELNSDRRWRRHNDSLDPSKITVASLDEGPETDFGHTVTPCERVYLALLQLPPEPRELLRQVYYRGRRQKDLAREAGISPAAMSQRLKKALALLEEAYRQG